MSAGPMLNPEEIALVVDALNQSATRYTLLAQTHYKGQSEQGKRDALAWAQRYGERVQGVIAKLKSIGQTP